MKREIRITICVTVFLLFTAVKMVSPAFAADLRELILPILDRTDDYRRMLHSVEAKLFPRDLSDAEPYVPDPPLTRLRETLDSLHADPMADLPKAASIPTPVPEPDPALEFGYAAREAFLQSQSKITEDAPPENVSYEIFSLPFGETSPVAGYTSSGFGYRMHPIFNEMRFHYGTDFAADSGTAILAFADGTVLAAGEDEGYGNYMKLDHGGGYVTLYGHCSKLLVSEGERVSMGQKIALVGGTGQATGPHLHFELIRDGVYLNPEFYLYA